MKNLHLKSSHNISKISTLLLVSLIAATLAGCGDEAAETAPTAPKVVGVMTVEAGLPAEELTVTKTASLKPDAEVTVMSEGAGKVTEVLFEKGDYVQKGQTLARLGEAISNTQDKINQTQASQALANARQTLTATENQVTESVKQAEIGLENAQLAQQNAISNREKTLQQLEESEKAARLGVETAEISLKNTQDSSYQSLDSAFENAETSINSALANATESLRQANNLLGIEATNTGINRDFRDYLGATNPQALEDARYNYSVAKDSQVQKDNDMTRAEIRNTLPMVEVYLNNILRLLSNMDILLQNTLASPYLTQTEIDTLRATNSTQINAVTSSLSSIEQSRQAIDSREISTNSSLESTEKQLENAQQTLATTLATNAVTRENLDYAVESAERNLRNAESTLKAAREGGQNNIISAQNAVNAAQQQYQLTTLAKNNTVVTAPIAGRITKRYVDPGTLVSAGSAIADIAVLDQLKMDVEYTFEESRYLTDSGAVAITIGDGSSEFAGEIDHLAPAADPVTRQIAVEITVPNPDDILKSNLVANARVPFNPAYFTDKILLPLKTVRIGQEKDVVLVMADGKVAQREVILGPVFGTYVEILDGLAPGDEIIDQAGNLQIDEAVTVVE